MATNQHTKTPPAALEAGFALGHLVDSRRALDSEIAEQVRKVIDLGGTWGHVGIMLGVSKQAAQQRYGKKA